MRISHNIIASATIKHYFKTSTLLRDSDLGSAVMLSIFHILLTFHLLFFNMAPKSRKTLHKGLDKLANKVSGLVNQLLVVHLIADVYCLLWPLSWQYWVKLSPVGHYDTSNFRCPIRVLTFATN